MVEQSFRLTCPKCDDEDVYLSNAGTQKPFKYVLFCQNYICGWFERFKTLYEVRTSKWSQ